MRQEPWIVGGVMEIQGRRMAGAHEGGARAGEEHADLRCPGEDQHWLRGEALRV